LLQRISIESLKCELGIKKYGHRIEIMMEIKNLFPSMGTMNQIVLANTIANSPMLTPMNVGSPMNTFYSPVVNFGTPQSGSQSVGSAYSPHFQSSMASIRNCSTTRTFVQKPETVSDVGNQNEQDSARKSEKLYGKLCCSNCNSYVPIREEKEVSSSTSAKERYQSKKLYTGVKGKSKRAGPTNPVEYVTLCKVEVRAGKTPCAKVLRELNEGQIVVINQIKGRSGRIVEFSPNRGYVKKGWVSMCTSKGRQLLVKYKASKRVT